MTATRTVGPNVGNPTPPEGFAADAEPIIEAIERPKQWSPEALGVVSEGTDGQPKQAVKSSPTEHRWLPKMDLPGFGDRLDDCGEDIPRFCECCGGTGVFGRTCRRSVCPRCARMWCMRQATALTAKIKAVWAYQYAVLDEHPYMHHLTISPPDDWILDGDPETVYWRTLDVIKDILEELNVAGVPIFHPRRGSDEEPGDDMGEWKGRIFEGREWDGDVEEETEFSPHFHIIAVSPHVDVSVTERVEEETGWVIHRIADDDGISIANDYDLARVVAYCLSHAGIYENSNGDMSAAYHPQVPHRVTEGRPSADEDTKEEADNIVRSVAPKVLGIDYAGVACQSNVDPSVASDSAFSLAAGSGDDSTASGEGSGDDSGDDQADVEADASTVKCEGRMLHISRATGYLNDPEWRAQAVAADVLERQYQEWKRKNGMVT